jgi:hypothetical protein
MRTRAGVGLACIALLAAACSSDPATSSGRSGAEGTSEHSADAGPVAGMPEWKPRAGLAIPRDDFATAVIGDDIWAFGGMSGDRGTRLRSIEIYDTKADSWRMSKVTMPVGLASFEAATIDDKVYVFGGLDKKAQASDFSAVLDTSTGTWKRLPPLPHPRYAQTVTLHDGLIYVIGGESADGPIPEVDIFDPESRTWSAGAPMPQPHGSHDTVSLDGLIYVLGGWLDAAPSDLVQTYDPDTGEWGTAPSLPEPVSRAGVTVLDGRIWVSLHEFAAVYDPVDQSWSRANALTVSRHGLGYVPVGQRIFGIGGCTESPLRDVRTVDVVQVS